MRSIVAAILFLTGIISSGQALRQFEPGEWRLKLGLPYVNSFYLQPENETVKSRSGFTGFEAGAEYQLTERGFLALDVSITGCASIPFGVLDFQGEFDRYSSASIATTHNRTLGRFSIGYGMSLAQNAWKYTRTFVPDSIPPTRDLVTRTSMNLGLTLNTYYRLGRALNVGFIYRPYFLKFDSADPWQYEHVISADVMWRIHFGRKTQLK